MVSLGNPASYLNIYSQIFITRLLNESFNNRCPLCWCIGILDMNLFYTTRKSRQMLRHTKSLAVIHGDQLINRITKQEPTIQRRNSALPNRHVLTI